MSIHLPGLPIRQAINPNPIVYPESEHQHVTLVTFTVSPTTYYWATRPFLLSGQWYEDRLADVPQIEDRTRDQFGLADLARFSLEVDNSDGALNGLDPSDAAITITARTDYVQAGSALTRTVSRQYVVDGWEYEAGTLRLEILDAETKALESLYPSLKFDAEDWPEILDQHEGQIVPVAVGWGIKVPMVLIDHNAGAGPYLYAGPEVPSGFFVSIKAVYRGGAVVPESEYTISSEVATSGYTARCVSFDRPQRDFSGQHYEMQCDVRTNLSRNAATELGRICTIAGIALDARSLAIAEEVAGAHRMFIDLVYGWEAQPRTIRSIIEDLLLILRGNIYKDGAGSYVITQDIRKPDAHLPFDADAGDELELESYGLPGRRPETVELAYSASVRNPTQDLQFTLSGSAGGSEGVERYELPILREWWGADRLHYYLRMRHQYPHEARARIYRRQLNLGDVITISSAVHYTGPRRWIVRGVRREPDCSVCDLLIYDEAVYRHVAGTPPAGALDGYQPDYSQTLPAAPTGLQVSASGYHISRTSQSGDDTATAWAQIDATPPAVNWQKLFATATVNAPGEPGDGTIQAWVELTEDGDVGTEKRGLIANLRPGEPYQIRCWAVNEFGVVGTVAGSIAHTGAIYNHATPSTPTNGLADGTYSGYVQHGDRLGWSYVTLRCDATLGDGDRLFVRVIAETWQQGESLEAEVTEVSAVGGYDWEVVVTGLRRPSSSSATIAYKAYFWVVSQFGVASVDLGPINIAESILYDARTAPDAPAAPTVEQNTAGATIDGVSFATVRVRASTVGKNGIHEVYFKLTGDISPWEETISKGTLVATDTWQVRFSEVPAGKTYRLHAWAEDELNVRSAEVQLGGSGTFVAATSAALGVPGGVSATAGTGKTIKVKWNAVNDQRLFDYVIYNGASANPTTEIARTDATEYIDTNVAYGVAEHYRIKSHSNQDLFSNYSASVNATPATIGTQDVTDDAITTRQNGTLTNRTLTTTYQICVQHSSIGKTTNQSVDVSGTIELTFSSTGALNENTQFTVWYRLSRGTTHLHDGYTLLTEYFQPSQTRRFLIPYVAQDNSSANGTFTYYIYVKLVTSNLQMTVTATPREGKLIVLKK